VSDAVSDAVSDPEMRVGLLGWGAIGRTVGQALAEGQVPGARLCAVAANRGTEDCPVPVVAPERLADHADLVVEAAGQEALAAHGETYLRAGADLLVVSVGALVDADLFARLQAAGGRRLHLTSGAIGGLDLLRAASRAGPLDHVTLTTTKQPASLLQDWMDEETSAALRAGDQEVVAFEGPAAEAVARFPQSVNVAATLALTAGSWDLVRVRVVADPAAEVNRHDIEIEGAAGRYRFTVENRPSPDNPKTSGIVPHAVVQGIAGLCGDGWRLAGG
jgi:aspartate dehydrogenase